MNNTISPSRHSTVVGGSTAAQVINCPASVKLCQQMPPEKTSDYAREGSMLHAAIAEVIQNNLAPEDMLGFQYDGLTLTEELMEAKLVPAVAQFDDLLDELETEYNDTATIVVETEVSFGSYIPDAFGSCDIILRVGSKAVVLDWKFGAGVGVSAENNNQLMFYAAAAMRTKPELFEDVADVKLVIVQPMKDDKPDRWVTTFTELTQFEKKLKKAVKLSAQPSAPIKQGAHCRWCKAQPICPLMNGAMDRAIKADIENIGVEKLGLAFQQTYLLETFIDKLRNLVQQALDNGIDVPGAKLVEKRATRKWAKEDKEVEQALRKAGYTESLFDTKLKSPAQMEKLLKKAGMVLPEELIESVSSGTTLVPESDKRPSVNAKVNLINALNKLNP